MACCCPPTKKDKPKTLGCVSLALFTLLLATLVTARGIWLICDAAAGINPIVNYIFGVLNLCAGLGGLFAAFMHSRKGIKIFIQAWKVYLLTTIIQTIVGWIQWGVNHDKEDKETNSLSDMIVTTVIFVIILCLFWWVLSNLQSHSSVIHAGGTGWEKRSASDLRGGRKVEEV